MANTQKDSTPDEVLFEFDEYSGKRWIYPNNYPVRGYQKQAVEMSLFKNSMIVLPTGLGKTFIAAVVMYNFYRWYPQGKIIFVAPTRPLVTQQMAECKKISGIPAMDCIELTGHSPREKRSVHYATKRVFFATPQVIENDLESRDLPAKEVRCIVIDEAHRAQGNFAYVGILRMLQEENRNGFRVMALSATPGSDIQKVRQVMLNLFISDIMFKSEGSIDLMQYKNNKISKAWTFELVGKHKEFVDRFSKICDPVIKELYRAGLTFHADSLERVSRYSLVKSMNSPDVNGRMSRGKTSYYISAALSMKYQFELLACYGIRIFYASMMKALNENRSALKTYLAGSVELTKLLGEIRSMFGEYIDLEPSKKPDSTVLMGHPKLTALNKELLNHFEKSEKPDTKAIVFTKYRESVSDIVQTIKLHEPTLKPGLFVGQSGMRQSEQIELVQDFKQGKYNILVATCVAEEGLDIGEVDLIICFDSPSSAISNTQRGGRTGRKRSGNIMSFLTKGYEEKKLASAKQDRRQIEEQLYRSENYSAFRYRCAPRMVPEDIKPICMEQKIFPLEEDFEEEKKPRKKRQRITTPKSGKKSKKQESCEEDLEQDLEVEERVIGDCIDLD